MAGIVEEIEREGRTATIHLHGDVVVHTAAELDAALAATTAQRAYDAVELDFDHVARLDTSALAVIELARRSAAQPIRLARLDDRQRELLQAFTGTPRQSMLGTTPAPWLERFGARVLAIARAVQALGTLIVATIALAGAVLRRRTRLPARAVGDQVATMGTDAITIVALLGFLLGISIAFQGAIQLRRLGAGSFVVDLVGYSMVRELAPLVTAVIVTGRTGAAIAAELGSMRAGMELDALTAMGIDPVRYVVVPRVLALVIVLPILTLIGMFVGLAGGMLVSEIVLGMSPVAYGWRLVDRLDLWDFGRGLVKSVAFAWIIGLAGAHLGLRARPDANGVGRATTRAVVAAVFSIIVFDALFESIATATGAW
jgi:phospholipid/cholesterol/gamma-HCH transport system permease protein